VYNRMVGENMKRYATILYDKAHHIIFHPGNPNYPPDGDGNPIEVVEVLDDDVEEGWDYDRKSNRFTPPVIPKYDGFEPSLAKSLPQQIESMQISMVIAGLIPPQPEKYYKDMFDAESIAESDLRALAEADKIHHETIDNWIKEKQDQIESETKKHLEENPPYDRRGRTGYEWL